MLAAKLNDVPDDQEIAGQVELFDECELSLNLAVSAAAEIGGEGSGIVSIARAFLGTFTEKRIHGLAGRDGIPGKLIAEIGERELEALGELAGVGDRLGKIGKETRP